MYLLNELPSSGTSDFPMSELFPSSATDDNLNENRDVDVSIYFIDGYKRI